MTGTFEVDPWRNALVLALEENDFGVAVEVLTKKMRKGRDTHWTEEESKDLMIKAFTVVKFLSDMG